MPLFHCGSNPLGNVQKPARFRAEYCRAQRKRSRNTEARCAWFAITRNLILPPTFSFSIIAASRMDARVAWTRHLRERSPTGTCLPAASLTHRSASAYRTDGHFLSLMDENLLNGERCAPLNVAPTPL